MLSFRKISAPQIHLDTLSKPSNMISREFAWAIPEGAWCFLGQLVKLDSPLHCLGPPSCPLWQLRYHGIQFLLLYIVAAKGVVFYKDPKVCVPWVCLYSMWGHKAWWESAGGLCEENGHTWYDLCLQWLSTVVLKPNYWPHYVCCGWVTSLEWAEGVS